MSIRLHKMMGYGLDDLKYDKENWKHIDERLNLKDGYFSYDMEDCDREEELEEKFNLDSYKKSVDKLSKEEKGYDVTGFGYGFPNFDDKKFDFNLYDVVNFQPEFGLPNVVCFVPPGCADRKHNPWFRYGDLIDSYNEETLEGYEMKSYIREIPGGIWPYNCSYQKDGVRLTASNPDYTFVSWSAERAKQLGYVPIPPESIVHLCRWLKIFNNEETIYKLKPMMYTYWA